MQRYENKRQQKVQDAKQEEVLAFEREVTTIYHGNGNQLSQIPGKSFIDAPSYLRYKEHDCFIPKKWLHTWQGHERGIQRIKFFPKTGHLLLSASHDGTCKIWDVMTHKRCIRTYMGHSKAVRDICFTGDGRKFLSAGFDKSVNLWDTETGKIIRNYQMKKNP
jgi:pre-mRNA-processing factor 17